MTKIGPKVTEKYFCMLAGDCQSADEPYDPASQGDKAKDGIFKTGRGSQGGGSKPTPQAAIMKKGSAKLVVTYPRHTQRLRGK